MKYYVYLSDSKIEMLYAQLDDAVESTSEASIGFDIKVLKAEIKRGREIKDNKFTRLESVVKQLVLLDVVGDVYDTKPYIHGTLDMRWASFGWDEEAPITMWGFRDSTIALGLAGSRHHIVGEQRPDGHAHSHSGTGAIEAYLTDLFDPETSASSPGKPRSPRMMVENFGLYSLTWLAVSQMTGIERRYEFVAKVLGRSDRVPGRRPNSNSNVVLASPIFVAQLD